MESLSNTNDISTNCENCGTSMTCATCQAIGTQVTNSVETVSKVEAVETSCITAENIIRSSLRKAQGRRSMISLQDDDLEEFNEIITELNNKNIQVRSPKVYQAPILGDRRFGLPYDLKEIITVSYGTDMTTEFGQIELSYVKPEEFSRSQIDNLYTELDKEIRVNAIDTRFVKGNWNSLSCDSCKSRVCGCGKCGKLYIMYYPKIPLS